MLPVIAIVGRPNVGKSTLFNRLTKTRDAIVADVAGLTRDRQYGEGRLGSKPYLVVDTGGLAGGDEDGVDLLLSQQSRLAIEECDVVVFVVDGRSGVSVADETIANYLRMQKKPIYLAVNKIDGVDVDVAMADYYRFGITDMYGIAASHGRGVSQFINTVLETFEIAEEEQDDQDKGIKFALIGRPNVGKSTLVNRVLGEERVVVFDAPGTTRDSVYIPFERHSQNYTIIDTAGVRRRGKVTEAIEKFSVIKTLQAIEQAHIAVLMLDARESIVEQDLNMLRFIIEAGCGIVIAINKWDGMDEYQRNEVKRDVQRRLNFIDYADIHFISALHGSGVGHIFESINQAYQSATKTLPTSRLTELLEQATTETPPPVVRGRRIKLRYAHAGGNNPPRIIIHGNQTARVPDHYTRYLSKFFRKHLKLAGTPVFIEYKTGENPYAGRRNKLTPRQEYKRKRMMKHHKDK